MENILHLGKFSNEQVGGIETVVDTLLSGLSIDFKLCNLVANNNFKNKVTEHTGYIEYSAALAGMVACTPICPSMPYQIKKLYRRYQFSMVHLHLPNPMAHLASEILPRSVKRIISWHSDVIRQKKLLKLYQPFVNRLLRQASALIVSTPYLAKHSLQINIARQRNIVHVIPYGIEFKYFHIDKYFKKIDQIKCHYSDQFMILSQ